LAAEIVHILVTSGQKPNIPNDCNPHIVDLLHSCWQMKPKNRPTFHAIVDNLLDIDEDAYFNYGTEGGKQIKFSDKFKKVSFFHTSAREQGAQDEVIMEGKLNESRAPDRTCIEIEMTKIDKVD